MSNIYELIFEKWLLLATMLLVAVVITFHYQGCRFFVIASGSMEPALSLGTLVVTKPESRYYPGQVVSYYKTQDRAPKITLGHESYNNNTHKHKAYNKIVAHPKSYSTHGYYNNRFAINQPLISITHALKDSQSTSHNKQLIITHRVISTLQQNGDLVYRTQGDANLKPDMTLVPSSNVFGRVWLAFPIIGYALLLPRHQLGFIYFILLPAAWLLYNMISQISVVNLDPYK